MPLRIERGQSLTEYALLLGVVGLFLFTMQTFVQRYVHARVKDTTDDLLVLAPAPELSSPIRRQRGLLTQLKGVDLRKPGTGMGGSERVLWIPTATEEVGLNEFPASPGERAYHKFSDGASEGDAHFEGASPPLGDVAFRPGGVSLGPNPAQPAPERPHPDETVRKR